MGICQNCEHFIHRMVGSRGGIRGVCELSCIAMYFWNSRKLTDRGSQHGCNSKFVDRKAPCKYADGCEGEWECIAYGLIDCPHTDIDYNYFDPSMGAKEINVVNCTKEIKDDTD